MVYTSPSVVIDNGSNTTRAGFSSEDIPPLVFNSNYVVADDKVIVGDDGINQNCQEEVMTLLDNGEIYDFDKIVHNWQYVYDNVDNGSAVNPQEYPLALTEPCWNSAKAKLQTCQVVFEQFQVPIFSLIKTPLAQLYHSGRSTGLVIDIGASVASVTPILDGIIQTKSAFHSKYAGDFLNLHLINYLGAKTSIDQLLPTKYASASQSFKNYYISHHALQDYKALSVTANYTQQPFSHYQLPQGNHISVTDSRNVLENLFRPPMNPIPGVEIPEPAMDKPHTHGLTNLVFLCLKSLEASMVPSDSVQGSAKFARFAETFKTLLGNILITGGTSLAAGLSDQILNDIRGLTPQYFPSYGILPYSITTVNPTGGSDISDVWEKQFSGWLGAANLASMLNDRNEESNSVNIAMENWFVTKADYEEMGEDFIVERFK
ncbi:actin [Diutina catenulata]